MLSKTNILALEKRKDIYNTILKYPGLHLRELSRQTNISFGDLRYHLRALKKQELIVIQTNKRYSRYYVNQIISNKDKQLFDIFRQEIPRKIILLLLIAGPCEIYRDFDIDNPMDLDLITNTHSKEELLRLTKYWKKPYDKRFFLKKHKTTVGYHIKKLLDAGIIEKIRDGKEMKYRLKYEDEIWMFLANNKMNLSDKQVNNMLKWYGDSITKRIDRVLEAFYEIIPNPYYV